MNEALPPFSGDETTCPKCGNEGASTVFLPDGTRCEHLSGLMIRSTTRNAGERLHRECRRCEYRWDEATL